MKIKILNIDDPLIIKELAVINQGFFADWEFTNTVDQADFIYDAQPDVTDKLAHLRVYLNQLTKHFNQPQPWGLLNAMRPNKLVHSLKKRGLRDEKIRTALQTEYLVSDEKVDLLLTVAKRQLAVIPDLYKLEGAVSLYLGIPFCPTRCAYCTFAAYAYAPNRKWVEPFLTALHAEIELVGQYLRANKIPVTTIYLGGGTPTMLSVLELENLLTAITTDIGITREITVEAGRPDSLDEEKLALLKKFQVNRISINPQSFNQATLDLIGRHHTAESVKQQFAVAKQLDIANINMDLIVGLPGEEQEELAYSLAQLKILQPESLTVHMLARKRKSELSKAEFTTGSPLAAVAPKTVLTEMAQMTYDFAAAAGYQPYYLYRQKNIAGNLENIGYGKPGYECQYNILMMEEAQTILGLGVGASSKFLIGQSVHNPKDLKTYIDSYAEYANRKLELLKLSLQLDAKAFVYNEGNIN